MLQFLSTKLSNWYETDFKKQTNVGEVSGKLPHCWSLWKSDLKCLTRAPEHRYFLTSLPFFLGIHIHEIDLRNKILQRCTSYNL